MGVTCVVARLAALLREALQVCVSVGESQHIAEALLSLFDSPSYLVKL